MGRLVLIRHCETDSNAAGTVQGRQDSSLSTRGSVQAELVGTYLKRNYSIDRVISSDRARCIETASAVNAPLTTTPLLRELDFGEWEGQKWSKIASDYPVDIERLLTTDHEFAAPGGDSLVSLNERISQSIVDHGLLNTPETVAVVSHDGTLRSLIARIMGWKIGNMGNLSIFVGSISVVSFSEQSGIPRLDLLNYYEHLSPTYQTTATRIGANL